MARGLSQLVAYGAQDVYLIRNQPITFMLMKINRCIKTIIRDDIEYKYVSCRSTMSFRKYNNFEIIFDDITIHKNLYNSNDLIYIYPINLRYTNLKPILDNKTN